MLRQALRANLIPAAALWLLAFALLGLYTFHAPSQAALDTLAAWKTRLGLGFSIPAQALVAGLLPFWLQGWQKGGHRRTQARHVPFLMAFFGFIGALNDSFYALQARMWGEGSAPALIGLKTLVDMGLYTPLVTIPLVTWAFALKDAGFSFSGAHSLLGRGWVRTRVLPTYAASLVVWTPALFVLYALPLALQFPFSALVQCGWSLMLVVLTTPRDSAEVSAARVA